MFNTTSEGKKQLFQMTRLHTSNDTIKNARGNDTRHHPFQFGRYYCSSTDTLMSWSCQGHLTHFCVPLCFKELTEVPVHILNLISLGSESKLRPWTESPQRRPCPLWLPCIRNCAFSSHTFPMPPSSCGIELFSCLRGG